MSATPQDILQSFDVLPVSQQRVVLVEICRRVALWDSDPVSDAELCQEADALFQILDEREQLDVDHPAR